ncbi:MAG TPA: hypothetical protein VMT76_07965 [Puia sp.]|nr:hypothetical protein [Puia sp.]
MKPLLSAFACFLLIAHHISAQDSLPEKKGFFKTKVLTLNAISHSGYLYGIGDSILFLSDGKQPLCFYGSFKNSNLKLDYSDIESLRLYRKGKIWRSTVIGAATGIIIGAVIGFAGGDDPQGSLFHTTAEEKALAGGTAVGLLGGITGLIIGLVSHKTFVLHGKKEKYNKMRNTMMTKLGL